MAGGDGAAIIVASPARVSDPRFLTILAARTKRRAFSLANQTEPAHVRAANVAGLFGSPIRFQIRIVTCLRDSGGDGEPHRSRGDASEQARWSFAIEAERTDGDVVIATPAKYRTCRARGRSWHRHRLDRGGVLDRPRAARLPPLVCEPAAMAEPGLEGAAACRSRSRSGGLTWRGWSPI